MGRAIVRDPQVFLFDEPLSNLDAKLRVAMRVEIKELHQRLKTTIVYVTHDQIEAMTMADKIVVMRDGRVEQIGAPLDLYDNPANVFVAGFIGSPAMNFIKGTVDAEDGRQSSSPTAAPCCRSRSVAAEPGRPVVYGIRPEHIDIGEGGLPRAISVLEPTGSETQIFARLGSDPIDAVVKDRLAAARRGDPAPDRSAARPRLRRGERGALSEGGSGRSAPRRRVAATGGHRRRPAAPRSVAQGAEPRDRARGRGRSGRRRTSAGRGRSRRGRAASPKAKAAAGSRATSASQAARPGAIQCRHQASRPSCSWPNSFLR